MVNANSCTSAPEIPWILSCSSRIGFDGTESFFLPPSVTYFTSPLSQHTTSTSHDPLNAVPVTILCAANFNVEHANMLSQTFDKLNCEHIRQLFYCKGITRTHTDKDNLQPYQGDPQPTHLLESNAYFHRFRWAYVSMLKTGQISMFLVSTVV